MLGTLLKIYFTKMINNLNAISQILRHSNQRPIAPLKEDSWQISAVSSDKIVKLIFLPRFKYSKLSFTMFKFN